MIKTDILIIGAGPTGLFAVFEAGLLNLKCHLIDALAQPGGQCSEIYPKKPIYDIPAYPEILAGDLTEILLEQSKQFKPGFTLGERAERIEKQSDGTFLVTTNKGTLHAAPVVVIAGGLGSFEPRKPAIDNISDYEEKGVAYMIKDPEFYRDKRVVIAGGGDSALDWTVELSKVADHIHLVHRRDQFRGAYKTEQEMRELVSKGAVTLHTPYLINDIFGDNRVSGVSLKNFETLEIDTHDADELLFLFGLNKKLGPILNWNLDINNKKVSVNTVTFETSSKGIFAVGDINDYPGKLNLILCGFHETTLAVQEAFKRCYPGERVPFGYTTSNKKLHEKLGVSKPK